MNDTEAEAAGANLHAQLLRRARLAVAELAESTEPDEVPAAA